MTDPVDPWELDPFGEGPYNPSLAFALVAARQAREKYDHAAEAVGREVALHAASANAIAASARKSATVQLASMQPILADVLRHEAEARGAEAGTESAAVDACLDALHRLTRAYDDLVFTVAKIATPDVPVPPRPPPTVPAIEDPKQARALMHSQLSSWVASRIGNDKGEMVVSKGSPGIGKTHIMHRVAYDQQQKKKRVIFATKTKELITGDRAEITNRIHAVSPIGRVHLAVIVGRDAENCFNFTAVEAAQEHGYSPGQAVCLRCEHYPDNARAAGFAICPYYEERIRASNLARGARTGMQLTYPIIVTTHASTIAAFASGGGRWGLFWSADLIMIDEDPTDAMETDVVLSETQVQFKSSQPQNRAANAAAAIYREAFEIGKRERSVCSGNGFKHPDSTESNTHAVHSKYGSAYTGGELHSLLLRAAASVRVTVGMPPLTQVLRDVAEAQSFAVQPGELVSVQSVADINAMHIPPKALATVSESIHREMAHTLKMRRAAYQEVRGALPHGDTLDQILATLEAETDVTPTSYIARIECIPVDVLAGRLTDEWRIVVRTISDLLNNTSTIVVGDAYALQSHYENLFRRPATMIDRVSMLHRDAKVCRILDSGCGISQMKAGEAQRILATVETLLPSDTRGKRVLIYGHNALRPKVEPWMEDLKARRGLAEIAYEHWWGGRGKDAYNGWEHTFCISDPIQSLSGILHTVNARAFRDSIAATDPDEQLEHGRQIALQSTKHGVVQALSSGHPRLAIEHERVNVAELTQAMHRSRPVHNPTRITVIGEMEMSVDLVAQTHTVAQQDFRRVAVSKAQRKSNAKVPLIQCTVDSFASPNEVRKGIQAIIDWYGVFSPYLAHALVGGTVFGEKSDQSVPAQWHNNFGTFINDDERLQTLRSYEEPRSIVSSLKTAAPHTGLHGSALIPAHGARLHLSSLGFQLESSPTDPSRGATPLGGPDSRTVVERVWHPPTYWGVLNERSLPHAVRDAIRELPKLDHLRQLKATRWAKWEGAGVRGAHLPRIFCAKETSTQEALALWYDLVDHQYGPVGLDGKLFCPTARREIPAMRWKDVPF